jgi:hypothetical protein
MSAVMLYPEMRKISAQEEEEEVDSVEESSGPGDAVRTKSSEKKLMTQIPLTILPCSSATSLYVSSSLHCVFLTAALQGASVVHSNFTMRLVQGISASLTAI